MSTAHPIFRYPLPPFIAEAAAWEGVGVPVRVVLGWTGRITGGVGVWLKSKSLVRLPRIFCVLADVGPRVGPAVGRGFEPLAAQEVVLDELVVGVEAEGLVVDVARLA